MRVEALAKGVADYRVEGFYYLFRAAPVEGESNQDKFDLVRA